MMAVATLLGTLCIYWLCRRLYQRVHFVLLSPVLTTFLIILAILLLWHIPYTTYMSGGKYLTDALQPATVAFAIPLYRYWPTFKRHAVTLLLSLVVGSSCAILTSAEFAVLLHLSHRIVRSIAVRSVTTPIAMDVSHSIGGVPVLTAVFVIVTGITGIIVGPLLIRLFRIRSAVGKGALMGMGAHGIGTARAFEEGPHEGTISSLSMICAGCITIVLAPLLVRLL